MRPGAPPLARGWRAASTFVASRRAHVADRLERELFRLIGEWLRLGHAAIPAVTGTANSTRVCRRRAPSGSLAGRRCRLNGATSALGRRSSGPTRGTKMPLHLAEQARLSRGTS